MSAESPTEQFNPLPYLYPRWNQNRQRFLVESQQGEELITPAEAFQRYSLSEKDKQEFPQNSEGELAFEQHRRAVYEHNKNLVRLLVSKGWKPNSAARPYRQDLILEKELKEKYPNVEGDGIWIMTGFNTVLPEMVEVYGSINAPGKGDEALALLAQTLQALANEYGRTFVDVAIPTHQAAEALFARNPNYTKFDEDGNPVWKRFFKPLF
jgi:hypothetical protein